MADDSTPTIEGPARARRDRALWAGRVVLALFVALLAWDALPDSKPIYWFFNEFFKVLRVRVQFENQIKNYRFPKTKIKDFES